MMLRKPAFCPTVYRIDLRLDVEPLVARILDEADEFRHLLSELLVSNLEVKNVHLRSGTPSNLDRL
jgi:hypothetical protein